jgi:hypothetical protein
MKFYFILVVYLMLWFFNQLTWATPSQALWKRETLLGGNKQHFFSMVIEKDYPPYYNQYTERLSVAKYAIATGELVEKIVIRETIYMDEMMNNQWTTEEQRTTSFDLNQFLRDNQIALAFPSDLGGGQLMVQENGLFLQIKKKLAVIRTTAQLHSVLPWFNQHTQVIRVYELNHDYYVLLESGDEFADEGGWMADVDSQQGFLIIKGEIYNQLWQALVNGKPTEVIQAPVKENEPDEQAGEDGQEQPNQPARQDESSQAEDESSQAGAESAQSTVSQPELKPWHVQVGCFSSPVAAETVSQQLTQSEIVTKILFSETAHCHRILLVPGQSSEDEAKMQAKQLFEKINLKGYVIMVNH